MSDNLNSSSLLLLDDGAENVDLLCMIYCFDVQCMGEVWRSIIIIIGNG